MCTNIFEKNTINVVYFRVSDYFNLNLGLLLSPSVSSMEKFGNWFGNFYILCSIYFLIVTRNLLLTVFIKNNVSKNLKFGKVAR